MKNPAPRTIIFDVETSHDILASYGLREQYHSPDNILQDWWMICAKWKWHGGKRIYGTCVLDDMKRFKKDCSDDYIVIKALHELMSDVEVVVGHNVHKFDWKMFYARVMFHRMKPLPIPVFVDTLKEVKKIAALRSNSLKHCARYFNLTPKIEHSRRMGLRILRGDIEATQECYDYCGGDIVTTEEFYDFIRPHMVSPPVNLNLWRADGIECCRDCGGTHLNVHKKKITRTGFYKQYQCQDCGAINAGIKRVKGAKIK